MFSKAIMSCAVVAFSATVFAQSAQRDDSTNLEKLDVLKTCVSKRQKDTAETVLTFMFNYKWWHIKNMYNAISPDYVSWHASRVYNAVVTPEEKRGALPFKNGLVTKNTFIEDLAMVAYTNDVPYYKIDISRVECAGNDTVMLSSNFSGISVLRDAQGYITHKVPLENLPTRFVISLKGKRISLLATEVSETATVNLWKKFKEIVTTTPPLPKDESTRTSYAEILAKFKKEAGIK